MNFIALYVRSWGSPATIHDSIPGAKVKDGRDYDVPGINKYLKDFHTL